MCMRSLVGNYPGGSVCMRFLAGKYPVQFYGLRFTPLTNFIWEFLKNERHSQQPGSCWDRKRNLEVLIRDYPETYPHIPKH